jgi:pre-mRNA-processing factor 6
LIQKGIHAFPDFEKLYMMGGQIYAHDLPHSAESLDKARKFYQRGLQAVPKCATLWILASRLEETAGSYVPNDSKVAQMAGTKARSLLELARLQHCPRNPDLWLEAIRLENRLGHSKLADTLLARALQECPDAGILWAEQLRMAEKSSQKRKAAEAIQRCPEDVHVIVAVAALFAKDGKEAKARKWFDRAVSVDPDHGDAWAYYYAYLKHRLKGQDSQAQVVQQQCVAAEPKHGEVWTSVTKDMEHRLKSTAEHLVLAAQKVVDAGFR